MRRFVQALVLGFVGLLVSAGGAQGEGPPSAVYLALGDSLGVGTGAPVEDQVGYVSLVFGSAHGVPHGNVSELVNLSVGGATSGTFISDGQLDAARRNPCTRGRWAGDAGHRR